MSDLPHLPFIKWPRADLISFIENRLGAKIAKPEKLTKLKLSSVATDLVMVHPRNPDREVKP